MTKPSIAFGIAGYGLQSKKWWGALTQNAVDVERAGFRYTGCLVSTVSNVDTNRNRIVDAFLKYDIDWLMWFDTDNYVGPGGIQRLYDVGQTLVSGVYYSRHQDGSVVPIAYVRNANGSYYNLGEGLYQWERGEIIEVEAAGMGCLLSHRSVYEDIKKKFTAFQRLSGGVLLVENDKVHGAVLPDTRHPYDGQVRKGTLYDRLMPVSQEDFLFPWFAMEYGRTEDMWFFEKARAAGHKLYLDTSIEAPHIKDDEVTGKDYRFVKNLVMNPEVVKVDYYA